MSVKFENRYSNFQRSDAMGMIDLRRVPHIELISFIVEII